MTGADILRIERNLGLSFWEFACRWEDPDGRIARKYAPHFRFSDEPGTPFVICLMHAHSQFHEGTTKCRFLVEGEPDVDHPLGVARCGIHGSRPSACRAFPKKLDETGDLAVIYDVPAPDRRSGVPLYQLCPRQWEPADTDPIDDVQELIIARYEMQFFHHLASIWNRQPHPWDVFPEFLRAVYSQRVVREELSEESLPTTIPFPSPVPAPQPRAA